MKDSLLKLPLALLFLGGMHTHAAEDKVEMGEKSRLEVGVSQIGADALLNNVEPGGFGYDVSIAGSHSNLDPGIKDSLLKFDAEGLQGFQLRGRLNYKSFPVFSLYYERPFSDSPTQKQILEKTQDARAGFEKWTGTFDFDFLTQFLSVENKFLSFLFSTRVKVSREFFAGEAISIRAMRFVPNDAQVIRGDINSSFMLDKFEDFQANEKLRFETEFDDKEITVSLVSSDKRSKWDFRMGAYRNSWKRPSSLDEDFETYTGMPVVFETQFQSDGAIFLIEFNSREPVSSLSFSAYSKFGINDTIETAVRELPPDSTVDPSFSRQMQDERVEYWAYGIEGWYTWKFGNSSVISSSKFSRRENNPGEVSKEEKQDAPLNTSNVITTGLYMTVGGSWEMRDWSVRYKDNPTDTVEQQIPLDAEKIWKIYARVGYVF